MRQQKNQNQFPNPRKPKTIQLKQPHKTCTCGACDVPKPKLPSGFRRLKIHPRYQKVNASQCYNEHYKLVPLIFLCGEWLQNIGFTYENHVIVEAKPGRLVIMMEQE